MGVDFKAIIDVSIDRPDLPSIRAHLDGLHDQLSPLWGGPCPIERYPRWTLKLERATFVCSWWGEDDVKSECRLLPFLEGPWGFHIVVFESVAMLWNIRRWYHFVEELDQREQLRQSARLIASEMGGRHIAYLPDLTVEDIEEAGLIKGPFGPIVSYLQKNRGNPSSLATAYKVSYGKNEPYFVEPI